MESEAGTPDSDDARAQLDLITADRQSLAQRVAQHPWWHTLASAALDKECDKRTGVSIMKPVGPKSLALVIVLVTVGVALFCASIGFMYFGLSSWIPLNSMLAAVVMIVGLRMLSRTMAKELLHAR